MAVYDLEEQEQLDELKSWWQQYRKLILLVIVVVVATGGGIQDIIEEPGQHPALERDSVPDVVIRGLPTGKAGKA